MLLNRSASVGSVVPGVDFILNSPALKLRGRGNNHTAAEPVPSPFSPWQARQCCSYTVFPEPRTASPDGCAAADATMISNAPPAVRSFREPGNLTHIGFLIWAGTRRSQKVRQIPP